jgi:hypothetical protein
MGYSAALSLEVTETTAGLRPGPDTTDRFLSNEEPRTESDLFVLVELPRGASICIRDFPRQSPKNDQDWRELLARCVDAFAPSRH